MHLFLYIYNDPSFILVFTVLQSKQIPLYSLELEPDCKSEKSILQFRLVLNLLYRSLNYTCFAGLISMIILIISLFLGVAANYSNEMKRYLSLRPVWYKFIHNGVGILGYAIGIVSLCYAYYTRWFAYYHGEESRLAALILTIVVSLWSINGAIVSAYNQIRAIIS